MNLTALARWGRLIPYALAAVGAIWTMLPGSTVTEKKDAALTIAREVTDDEQTLALVSQGLDIYVALRG